MNPKKKETSSKGKGVKQQNFVSTCHHNVLQSTHDTKRGPLLIKRGGFETSAPPPSQRAAAPLRSHHEKVVTNRHHLENPQLEESPPRALSPRDSHECEESDAPRRWPPLDPLLRQ